MRFVSVLGLALALAAAVAAQPPAAQPPAAQPAVTNPYPTPLYRLDDVGKALTLTSDQVTRLNTVTDRIQTQYRDNYAKIGTLAEAERAARLRELNRQYADDWNKASRDIFNDTQRTRYQQLNYQYGGFDTLYYPDVQTRLALTPAQIKDLNAQAEWNNQQYQTVYRIGLTDPTKGTQLYRDYWTQRQERFNKFLTAEQQKTWAAMVGDPYAFQPHFGPRR